MQVIFQSNPQQVFMTDIHDNQVANVTIGTNEAKQRPTVPMEEPEEVSCEIVPEAQETIATPMAKKSPASSSTLDLSELELLLLNRLKEAGYLDSHYQLYTQESIQKGGQLLTTGQSVALSQQLGKRCNVSDHIQRYCKQLWHMPQKDGSLRSAVYKFNDESGEKAKKFWTEINRVMDGNNPQ